MSEAALVSRFRAFLLLLACALCVGIIAELVLTGHYKEPLQLAPIALSVLGFVASLSVLLRPSPTTIRALQVIMIVAGLSGFVGVYAHLSGNLELAQEVNAAKASAAPLLTALTGRNPALAPGAMGVTAIIALAATYYHPAFETPEKK